MITVKHGVTPKNLVIEAAAANVADLLSLTVTVTSGTDGVHMEGSKHYTGDALDFRLLGERTTQFLDGIRARLGPDYDVVLEADHIHVEFDPW